MLVHRPTQATPRGRVDKILAKITIQVAKPGRAKFSEVEWVCEAGWWVLVTRVGLGVVTPPMSSLMVPGGCHSEPPPPATATPPRPLPQLCLPEQILPSFSATLYLRSVSATSLSKASCPCPYSLREGEGRSLHLGGKCIKRITSTSPEAAPWGRDQRPSGKTWHAEGLRWWRAGEVPAASDVV